MKTVKKFLTEKRSTSSRRSGKSSIRSGLDDYTKGELKNAKYNASWDSQYWEEKTNGGKETGSSGEKIFNDASSAEKWLRKMSKEHGSNGEKFTSYIEPIFK